MRRPWIKVEVATPDKPEICAIANRLKMDEDMVVGKLVRFWAWVAQNQVHGSNLGVTLDFIDRLVGRKGFALAVCQAGWLIEEDGVVSIPNFDRHNSNLARTRALTKTRVERHRKVTSQKLKKKASTVTVEESPPEPTPAQGDEDAMEELQEESIAPSEAIPLEQSAEVEVAAEESAEEVAEEVAEEEQNDELSINALPTFDSLQSESVVEKVMEGPAAELEPDEPEVPAKPEKASKKKEDPFNDQPMLF